MGYPDFSPGDVLAANDMDAVGLWLVKTQTIGSGVSSVTVTDAFSADYDNYKITVTGGVASISVPITLQLGASATGYYGSFLYCLYTASTPVAAGQNNVSAFGFAGVGTANNLYLNIDLTAPFLAKKTGLSGPYLQHSTGASASGTYGGFHDSATSYTSFTIATAGATMTGGTIRVYGYRN